ncbi:MAG: hypothetical protein ACD_41C00306G0014 [uncultured bacterium]|nr:MAG: hypothetical protein ACD_41C00306G0014 [uncultured bacterium]HBY74253.1 hypothetical protein [Candidatus Kerfeldbacteria bacterium]
MKRYFALSVLGLATLGASCASTTGPTTVTTDDNSAEDIYFEEDSIAVEAADVYGKDLEIVTRYPDSIRSYYSSNEYETDVTYQTTASTEDVRTYYNDAMAAAGWENSEEATDYMEYLKGDEDNPEIFTVYFTSYDDQGIVEYELVYEPALTDEQLQALEEEDFEF